MKKQKRGKEVEAGQNLKRPKTTKGKCTVNGKAVFENGNLVKPKVALLLKSAISGTLGAKPMPVC